MRALSTATSSWQPVGAALVGDGISSAVRLQGARTNRLMITNAYMYEGLARVTEAWLSP